MHLVSCNCMDGSVLSVFQPLSICFCFCLLSLCLFGFCLSVCLLSLSLSLSLSFSESLCFFSHWLPSCLNILDEFLFYHFTVKSLPFFIRECHMDLCSGLHLSGWSARWFCHFVRQKLWRWTSHANFSTKRFCTCHEVIAIINFYHYINSTFIDLCFSGGHTINAKEKLLASFSRTVLTDHTEIWYMVLKQCKLTPILFYLFRFNETRQMTAGLLTV